MESDFIVSVCCITYNHSMVIRDAIDSFLMQNTSFAFEIIIHDDASTDGTQEILLEYASKYPEIIKLVLQKENQYSKKNLIFSNYVFPKVSGKYIALCEGDDYWLTPDKLQTQVEYLENHPDCAFTFHAAIQTDYYAKKEFTIFPYNLKRNCICSATDVIFPTSFPAPTASVVFRSGYVSDLPKYFFNKCLIEDYPLMLLLISKGYAYYFNQEMSVYRKGVNDSWTLKFASDFNENKIAYYENLIDFVLSFNNYTGLLFNDAVQLRINDIKIKIMKLKRDIKGLRKKDNLCFIFKYYSKRVFFKYFLYIYFTKIYYSLEKIYRGLK